MHCYILIANILYLKYFNANMLNIEKLEKKSNVVLLIISRSTFSIFLKYILYYGFFKFFPFRFLVFNNTLFH